MAKISVMTWNTSLYLEKTHSPNIKKYETIVNEIKRQLKIDNSIVFLQEIPYVSNETWQEHSLYSKLKNDFLNEEYDFKFNVISSKQIMMTVAIARKGKIEIINSMINDNRTISVEFNGLRFTGIHAKNGKDNKRYLASINNNDAQIILGDFNAGNYERSENRDSYNRILSNYSDVCNQITTVFDTPIDHVLVDKDTESKCVNLIVNSNIKYSDHFPITFEINN